MHPFGKLTRDEQRVLRFLATHCGSTPDPVDLPIVERLKKWLDEAVR